jgi:hypothetical protein
MNDRPNRRILVCQGRPIGDDNQPVGEPCGRTLTVRGTISGFRLKRQEAQ